MPDEYAPILARGNLFADAKPPADGERFETLLALRNLVIERIVSSDAPESKDYEQTQDEWVLLASGEAALDVAGKRIALKPGDYLFLPAGVRHRVLQTAPGTVWLALHLHPDRAGAGASTDRDALPP